MQRLTTCVSLYAYNPSVGLDDCLLSGHTQSTARRLMAARVEAHGLTTNSRTESLPYRLDEEESEDAEVGRLVQLRAESELYVTQHVLSQRHHHTEPTWWSAASAGRVNQIALFAMLGTKGSVSNLIQCCHSLGQPLRTCVRTCDATSTNCGGCTGPPG